MAARAAARCRWMMRDTESAARTRVETGGSKDCLNLPAATDPPRSSCRTGASCHRAGAYA
jgi:hypothetical protein